MESFRTAINGLLMLAILTLPALGSALSQIQLGDWSSADVIEPESPVATGGEGDRSSSLSWPSGFSFIDDLPCNASLYEPSTYAQELRRLINKPDTTGVVLDFKLWPLDEPHNSGCLSPANAPEPCNLTQAALSCDAAFSNTTGHKESRAVQGNVTLASHYFHPLQQIWSRRLDPSPILSLHPDRVVLSMTLLSDDHLHVPHLAVGLLVSSSACWRRLNQTTQSRITLTLSFSSTVGLSAAGVQNGTGQLCQLRYADKFDYALFSDNSGLENQEFAFSCCSADSPGAQLTCAQLSSFSRWYDGNTLIVFWGIVLTMLLCPLPFVAKLAPASPAQQPADTRRTQPSEGTAHNPTLQAGDDIPLEASTSSNERHVLLSEAVSDFVEPVQQLKAVHSITPVSYSDVVWAFIHSSPHRFFASNTGAPSHLPITPLFITPTVLRTHQVTGRIKWLLALLSPLVILALRVIAYRVSSYRSKLSCMAHLGVPTPWLLLLFTEDFVLLAAYIALGLVCVLANPDQLYKLTQQQPSNSEDTLFPPQPISFHSPASGTSSPGLIPHTVAIFRKYSLSLHIYHSHIEGAPAKAKSLWIPLWTLALIPDCLLLITVAALSFVYSTPTGYALIRWSRVASSSVTLVTKYPWLNSALGILVGCSWFVMLLSVILLLLLSATWIISTLQFTIVGMVYNLEKYLDYVIQISTFILYLRHYWQQICTKYNKLQVSVIDHYRKIQDEEKLVQRIAAAVHSELHDAGNLAADADNSAQYVPSVAFHNVVTQAYPVRYVVLQAILAFLGVCVYLAALNATLLMTGKLQKYSALGKSAVLAVGSALPKILDFLTSDEADKARKLEARVEHSVRVAAAEAT